MYFLFYFQLIKLISPIKWYPPIPPISFYFGNVFYFKFKKHKQSPPISFLFALFLSFFFHCFFSFFFTGSEGCHHLPPQSDDWGSFSFPLFSLSLSLSLSLFSVFLSFFLSFFLQKGITRKKGFIFIIYYLFILFNTRLCSQKVDLGLSICYGLLQNLGLSICYVYLIQDSVLMIIECM